MLEMIRRMRRRRLGRVLIRNAEWADEARYHPSLWNEWNADLSEPEFGEAADEEADGRGKEWTSAYSAM